jgi:hypothetical protein
MMKKTHYTVWSYMSTDDENKPRWRTIFFYAGSIDYHGGWMKASDSVWIVPTPSPWLNH